MVSERPNTEEFKEEGSELNDPSGPKVGQGRTGYYNHTEMEAKQRLLQARMQVMISETDLLKTHSRQLYRFQQNQFQELVRLMPDLVLRKALEMNQL